jgi:hypothetical protein
MLTDGKRGETSTKTSTAGFCGILSLDLQQENPPPLPLSVPVFLPQSPASRPQIEAPLATNSAAALMGEVDGGFGWWVVAWAWARARQFISKFWFSVVQFSPSQIHPLCDQWTSRGNVLRCLIALEYP